MFPKRSLRLFISSILLLGLLVPVSSFAQTDEGARFPTSFPILEVPDTLEGVKEGTERIGKEVGAGLLISVQNIWREEVVPKWREMFSWTNENIWTRFAQPYFYEIGDSIKRVLGKEVEKRKPLIEQKLEQERQELQEEITKQSAKATRNLWERFLALFR